MSSDPFSDDFNGPDPTDPHSYFKGRADHLRKRYGGDDEPWDKDFGGLDLGAAQARRTSQELKDTIAAAGIDETRPMTFNVRIANRDVRIQVRQTDEGEFTCQMPIQVAVGYWEWRTLLASSYDSLIGMVNRALAAAPVIRNLTPEEELELARNCMPPTKENLAVVMQQYLKLRLGPPGEHESCLHDPRYARVVDEMVLFLMKHAVPDFPNTPQAVDYIRKFAAGRPLNFPMAKAAFARYQKEQKAAEPPPPQINDADLAEASDTDIAESLRGIARARAEQDRKKRALVYGQ
jgi:hypothetical protein